MDVSIIIISYCTRELTLACLDSVYRETRDVEFEVLVADNASDDGSAEAIAERFPQARLWANQENLGFGRANNELVPHAKGKYLLLLNPDTLVLDGAVQRVVEFARRTPQAGIWGGRTVDEDGNLDLRSCWSQISVWSSICDGLGLTALGRGTSLFNPEAMPSWRRDSEREVDIVVGCFLLIEKSTWEQLNGFDPAFFMYGEEADLCLRARRAGYAPRITPGATILHYGGASERIPLEKQIRILRARAQLVVRHMGPVRRSAALAAMKMKALLRGSLMSVLSLVRPSWKDKARTWRVAWARRGEWTRSLEG